MTGTIGRTTVCAAGVSKVSGAHLFGLLVVASLAATGVAAAEPLRPGAWDVTSTVVVLQVPGVPGFIERMARGRSKAEHKRLTAGQDVGALLAPDPKAQCHVDAQHVDGGRYQQLLTCPQKRGGPVHIVRTGTFDANGFAGDATVDGTSSKGTMHIVLRQQARRTGD